MSRNYSDLFKNYEAEMLADADKAITECDLWDWLRDYRPKDGFMFSDHPNLTRINDVMKYRGHSGASYGWTMRHMEYIAKHGWTLFEFKIREQNAKTVLQNAKSMSPLDVAEASRDVPGFEGQADAMTLFYQGKISYAQMRSICG